MKSNFKVIGFDADDTLWVNEPYYKETEESFCDLLSDFESHEKVSRELFKTEMQNLELYGYGIKSFILSLIETSIELSNEKIGARDIKKILDLGKNMLTKPIDLLNGVEDVLKTLSPKYRLIVATKGDLLDQERKLKKSGLIDYFDHVEILSEKKKDNYMRLIDFLNIEPSEFLMIGNSLKSDVLPIVEVGANAIHIPYHTTWAYEEVKDHVEDDSYLKVDSLLGILKYL